MPDLVITDLKMPGMDGLELLAKLRGLDACPPIIFLTAHGSIAQAVEAMKLGAFDFLEKPYSGADLVAMARRALKPPEPVAVAEVAADEPQLMASKAPAMRRVLELMERVAPTPSTVLITGDSGTGKELAARALHRLSGSASSPLVVIDCGALPDTLLESELFGHRKGSFTSATQDRKGLLEMADGGTVFLDEIGNISPSMQTRMLRFLQNGELRRIGDTQPRKVNVRVIAATNRDLAKGTTDGSFREDLYYRLKVVTIQMPALRERREDIPDLAEHFVRQAAVALRRPIKGITDRAMEHLKGHSWPGNVRELQHVIEAGVALSRGELLDLDDLVQADFVAGAVEDGGDDAFTTLERTEREQIIKALQENAWVQKRAADVLGISGRVIHYKIRKYGIQIPRT
jgi:DNA-binding NtrC family response regulator